MKTKVFLASEKATEDDLREMLESHVEYIKIAVDIRESKLAGGGEFHADCEAALILLGSQQDFIWGADWIPETQEIRFEALINIRPRLKNPSTTVLDPNIQKAIEDIARPILGKV